MACGLDFRQTDNIFWLFISATKCVVSAFMPKQKPHVRFGEVLCARIAKLERLAIVTRLPDTHKELVDLHEFLDSLHTMLLERARKRLH